MPIKPKLPEFIRNEKDIRAFFKYLYVVDSLAFHPDEKFETYGHYDDQQKWIPLYTRKQAREMNRRMAWAWELVGDRIFDIALQSGELWGLGPRGPKDWSPLDR